MQLYLERNTSPINQSFQICDESRLYPVWQKQAGRIFDIPGGWIQVIHPGERNLYSGPDFRNCILLDSTGNFLHGDVEIHSHMNDWNTHHHSHHPEYSNVILHVVKTGIPHQVNISENYAVPTIVLSNYTGNNLDPCHHIESIMGAESLVSWINLMARMRWDQILRELSVSQEDTVYKIFKMISIRGNEPSLKILVNRFYQLIGKNHLSDTAVLSRMHTAGKSIPWNMGKRRPASHPTRRIPFVSLIAWMWVKDRSSIQLLNLHQLEEIKNKIQNRGYPVPGKTFLKELMGNIVHPLTEIQTGMNCFSNWAELKLPPYSLTRQYLSKWGIGKMEVSFELQQGILQIDKEFCQIRQCDFCPAGSGNPVNIIEMNSPNKKTTN
ncbi:MAG: DUF2851 family protein [Fidelibacterota bacterium]